MILRRSFLIDFLEENEISVMFPLDYYATEFIAKNQDEFRKYTDAMYRFFTKTLFLTQKQGFLEIFPRT